MINKIWAQVGVKVLAEIADIYPRMTSIHDSSLFDDSFAMDFINYGDKIIYCAMDGFRRLLIYICSFEHLDRKTMFAIGNSNGKTKKGQRSKTVND